MRYDFGNLAAAMLEAYLTGSISRRLAHATQTEICACGAPQHVGPCN